MRIDFVQSGFRDKHEMIGYLKGILFEKKPNSLILDVNGIGYLSEYSGFNFS